MAETTLYNPASLREDDLIANFVVRTRTFEKIFKDISSSTMQYPEKHYLIQGQRGMGKTTLLLRLKYEIERTETLNNWLIPVFFNEETYDINNLASLWEKLLKYLDEHFETDGAYYDYTDRFVDLEDYERLCFNFLIEKLREREKKLIIFFDNFGELFLDNLREKEKRRLREILIECSDIRIIGASAVVINDLHDYSQPFFEFFHIVYLEGLTKDETYELIAKLQEDCSEPRRIDLVKHKAKIDTLAVLTGGVIRTIMMLYQVLLDDPNGKALEDLEKVLDKATPLYKHRIEDLPVQQRRIVDVIAKKWDAVSAREIASEIREDGKSMSTKLISAQLSQLEKNNVVEKKGTTTKNYLYQLRERFFNIWYLMRNGDRRDRKRVAWLTKFLEIWYDDDDSFDAFIKNHINALRSGKYMSNSALLIAEALASSDKFDIEKVDGIVHETSNVLREEQRQYLPNMHNRRMAVAIKYYNEGNINKTVEALLGVKERDTNTNLLLAHCYFKLGNNILSKETLYKVDKIDDDSVQLFKFVCLELNDYQILFKVVERSQGLDIALAQEVIGEAYFHQKMYDLAQGHYEKAISLGRKSTWEKLIDVYESKGNLIEMEKLLVAAYNEHLISRKTVAGFYALKVKNSEKVNQWIEGLEKDGDYYVYSALALVNKLTKDSSVAIEEIIPNLEKSLDLFGTQKEYSSNAMVSATILLVYYNNILQDYKLAQNVVKKANSLIPLKGFYPYNILKAFVSVWGKDYSNPDVIEVFESIDTGREDSLEIFNELLVLLMAKHQYHFLLKQFDKHINLKEVFKPIYYALMTLMEDEMPNEVVRMGDELKVPVEEILEKVEQMKIDYK